MARALSIRQCGLALLLSLALAPLPIRAASGNDYGPGTDAGFVAPAYADLVDLLDGAPLVLTAQIRKIALVDTSKMPAGHNSPRPGWARLYVEARTLTALRGSVAPGATLGYLADVALDARGKLPALGKRTVLLVARPVADHPDMLQLVAPDAQLAWNAALEARMRAVLAELQGADAPSPVTRVREAIYVPGDLVGAGETQIFLATANASPAAISVVHHPGQSVASWSVSFSEVVDASGQPPKHDTLAWYRLACFLPDALPEAANVSATPADKGQAIADYRLVMAGLGPCGRSR